MMLEDFIRTLEDDLIFDKSPFGNEWSVSQNTFPDLNSLSIVFNKGDVGELRFKLNNVFNVVINTNLQNKFHEGKILFIFNELLPGGLMFMIAPHNIINFDIEGISDEYLDELREKKIAEIKERG